MSRSVADPCGDGASPARYRAHLRAGEETCPDCRRKHAEYVATFRQSAPYRRTPPRLPHGSRKVAA